MGKAVPALHCVPTRHESGAQPGAPTVSGTASDLLLWLYGRLDLDLGSVPADLIARFRALCFTD